jgi:CheY-like chemotaxis protein
MGGTVRVRTERGVGTTFTIELPLAEGPLAGAPPSVVTTPRGGCSVLVVDDQPEVRRTIARVLEAEGYRALQAADGVEALETIESEEHIDLVVSDVVMPRMNGADLASALEQRKPKLPVLLMTGYADAAQLGRKREVISKPFAIADLLASVAKALV